jgi:hypothetical protein
MPANRGRLLGAACRLEAHSHWAALIRQRRAGRVRGQPALTPMAWAAQRQ